MSQLIKLVYNIAWLLLVLPLQRLECTLQPLEETPLREGETTAPPSFGFPGASRCTVLQHRQIRAVP